MYPLKVFDHNDIVADELYSSAAFIANKGGVVKCPIWFI